MIRNMIALFVCISLFALFVTAQESKVWPTMFEEPISIQRYTNYLAIVSTNWPITEGDDFEMEFSLDNVTLNRNATQKTSEVKTDVDFAIIRTISEFSDGPTMFNDIPYNLTNTNFGKLNFTFPQESTKVLKSHKIHWYFSTQEIGLNSTFNVSLTKSDQSIKYILEKPHQLVGNEYTNLLADEMIVDMIKIDKKNATDDEIKHLREFKIQLNNVQISIDIQPLLFQLTSNATSWFNMVPYDEDVKPSCNMTVTNVDNVIPFGILASDIGTVSFQSQAPFEFPKNSNATITCDNAMFKFNNDDILKETLSFQLSTSYIKVPNTRVPLSVTTIIDPLDSTEKSWTKAFIVSGIVLGVVALVFLVAMICRRKQRAREEGNIQSPLLGDY